MNALTFTLELAEPLLIANPISGDENSATGLHFIPGSAIRGVLVPAFTNGRRGDLQDDIFKRLFFSQVMFLNAYLTIDNQRALPTPLSFYREKHAREFDPIIDLANPPSNDFIPNDQVTGVSMPFGLIQAVQKQSEDHSAEDDDDEEVLPTVKFRDVERHVNMHVFQPDRLKAVRSGRGTVFRYDALAAGQQFQGTILSHNDDNLDTLQRLLEGKTLKLGKSRSAGYGTVNVLKTTRETDWNEYPVMLGRDDKERRDYVVVTLLSDAIVRDPQTGGFAASLVPLLKKPIRTFARTHIIGGFNLTWGLPIPQVRAMQAGSVFVFKYTDELREQLDNAKQQGIGERRIEGFGRIAVNWHTVPQLTVVALQRETKPRDVALVGHSSASVLAQQMTNRIWRDILDAALRDAISMATLEKAPPNSQLARIRVLAREAWRTNDVSIMKKTLEKPDNSNTKAMRPYARQYFEYAHIKLVGSKQSLLTWLQTLADRPTEVWNEIGVDGLHRPVIGGVHAEDPPALEYAARLIDGVFRKAVREETD